MDYADSLIENEARGGCTCIQCRECRGSGKATLHRVVGRKLVKDQSTHAPCPFCKGTGLKNAEMCDYCKDQQRESFVRGNLAVDR
jgi:DnaJ-class molecular chaperone